MSEPVDEDRVMDAIKTGSIAALKASIYLEMVSQMCVGIEQTIQLMDSGRQLDARNLLAEIHKTVASKLGT
jgi:hypothetical protein